MRIRTEPAIRAWRSRLIRVARRGRSDSYYSNPTIHAPKLFYCDEFNVKTVKISITKSKFPPGQPCNTRKTTRDIG